MALHVLLRVAACALTALILSRAPVRADVVFSFVCANPTADCDGDATFHFELRFADTIVGGTTITAADPLFLGFYGQSSVGDGFSISGNYWASTPPSNIAFTFDLNLTEITKFDNTTTGVSEIVAAQIGVGRMNFFEGFGYFLTSRADISPAFVFDNTWIDGRLVRVHEPMSLSFLGTGLLVIGIVMRRRVLAQRA